MKKMLASSFCLMLLFILLCLTPKRIYAFEEMTTNQEETVTLFNQMTHELVAEERKLWSDHMQWTRNYIISEVADLEDKATVAERLLRNQDDLGAAIKPYYGEEIGQEFAALLREHILIAADVLSATKVKNKVILEETNERWHENADQIALFLNQTNPYWDHDAIKEILDLHLKCILEGTVARMNKDWVADIVAQDIGYEHMLKLADILSSGIIKQFPEKFAE